MTLLADPHHGFGKKMEEMAKSRVFSRPRAGNLHILALGASVSLPLGAISLILADFSPNFPIFMVFGGGDQREVSKPGYGIFGGVALLEGAERVEFTFVMAFAQSM